MTGHPDHIAVSRWVTMAVGRTQRPIRVLYATTTADFVRRWEAVHRDLDVFGDGLPLSTPSRDIAVEVQLDEAELDRKFVALAAQSSQMQGLIARLGEATFRAWWATETFTLAARVET